MTVPTNNVCRARVATATVADPGQVNRAVGARDDDPDTVPPRFLHADGTHHAPAGALETLPPTDGEPVEEAREGE